MLKIGLGRDIHRLIPGRRFLLGGVELPFDKGEAGHSDGDVLCHAVIDAVLGAAGLGDIGEFFPVGDPQWKDADSTELLRITRQKFEVSGWQIINIDCVVCCENPKILPYREEIRSKLAQVLGIERDAVFVKGKTNEGIGELGNNEAVEALVICLAEKK
ncbi:MAG: 2-C-methyl-D-erythritol 2,4-cyclodiphosphate synthase [Treponema sp.]|jgi:2-C-methyl-D-erythritol 2,4-cyclodiphosphate synthase/2-C-methyl-D-erythritol 4-phosphate cytidylyltransferase/2-C-methyl-D-erythritol 2,4-cyclodiphosphate synthase|nr:2-C-methyl-D-erythritol 2,4-cyclodiphosphate synthase [Treponema sp.]